MSLNLDQRTGSTKDVVTDIEIFTLNGVTYSVKNKTRVNIALKYMDLARKEGQDAAGGYLIEALLGADAYAALMDWEDLTMEILSEVIAIAQKIVLGDLTDPKGMKNS